MVPQLFMHIIPSIAKVTDPGSTTLISIIMPTHEVARARPLVRVLRVCVVCELRVPNPPRSTLRFAKVFSP